MSIITVKVTPESVHASASMLLAQPDLFGAWLRLHSSPAPVGERCNSATCPLAAFLQAHLVAADDEMPLTSINVTPNEVVVVFLPLDSEEHIVRRMQLPLWAWHFVNTLDGGSETFMVVTTGQALQAWREACQKAGDSHVEG